MTVMITVPVTQAKVLVGLLQEVHVHAELFAKTYNGMRDADRKALIGRYGEILGPASLRSAIKGVVNAFDNSGLSVVSGLNDLTEYLTDDAIKTIEIDLFTLSTTKRILDDWRTINGKV